MFNPDKKKKSYFLAPDFPEAVVVLPYLTPQ